MNAAAAADFRPRVLGHATRPRRRAPKGLRRVLIACVLLGVLACACVAIVNLYMSWSVRGEVTSVAAAPHAQAAVVLGALVNDDGSMSPMLADRVQQGAALYKAGKVDRVIVSGDHHTWAYDEPGTMRKALRAAGVPAHAIFTDHAGFDTWASMRRAREVFKVNSAIVVTQGFHMTRALYLAKAAGLHATGVTADLQPYGRQTARSEVREVPARVKAFFSATRHAPVLLGPVLPISGDGRVSWGPAPPK